MKFPESWLREQLALEHVGRDQLDARLTAIGLEVEGVEVIGAGLQGVVVGHILEAAKHPEADRLQVCRVDAGAHGVVQIVCGAPNARAGLKAPLALVGARLPGGLQIKAATLRGVDSAGMLCSAKELGLDADASGLWELAADAPVGADLAAWLGLPDASFELKLTPNRADCFSVRGVAYDVAAAFGSEVRPLDVAPAPVASAATRAVALEAGAAAPRYCGRVIEGVDAGVATPAWMAQRLARAGVRPLSFLVDVTQYVMLELGQPMHAFDDATLAGAVRVRHAAAGERLALLDGREVALDPGFLVIADDRGALALAGIMGGQASKVTDATRTVFLESAHFAPDAIIGRSRKLGLHTDASHRFERGVDPQLPRIALERATALILQVAGGQAGPVVEAALDQHLAPPAPVALRRARLARVLGITVADAEVERILRALGMQVAATAEGWVVTPPSRRFDIAIEEDLIEEVVRIHGYEAVPTASPSGRIRPAAPSETRVEESTLRRQLAARDYREAIDYAFLDARILRAWGLDAGAVALANPLSTELGVMRTALLPGLVESLRANRARQQGRVRLFELGRVFHLGAPGEGPVETRRVAAIACGDARAEQWGEAGRAVDFFDVKGDLESLLALAGEGAAAEFRPAAVAWLHPGRSAEVWRAGVRLGWIGHLHPGLARALDLEGEVVGFELDLDPLLARAVPRAGSVSRFPSVRRDLAFVVPEATAWGALEASLRAALGPLLREVVVFDRYAGKGVEPGFKSLAMGLILQDSQRTLSDHDAEQAVAAAVAALEASHGARIRG